MKKKPNKKRESPRRAVQRNRIAARGHDAAKVRGPANPIAGHIEQVADDIAMEKRLREIDKYRGIPDEAVSEARKEFAQETAREIMNIILAGHGEELLKAVRKGQRLIPIIIALFDVVRHMRRSGKPLNVPMLMQELARLCGGKARIPYSERWIRKVIKAGDFFGEE